MKDYCVLGGEKWKVLGKFLVVELIGFNCLIGEWEKYSNEGIEW